MVADVTDTYSTCKEEPLSQVSIQKGEASHSLESEQEEMILQDFSLQTRQTAQRRCTLHRLEKPRGGSV